MEEASKLDIVVDRRGVYFILFKVLKEDECLIFEECGEVWKFVERVGVIREEVLKNFSWEILEEVVSETTFKEEGNKHFRM